MCQRTPLQCYNMWPLIWYKRCILMLLPIINQFVQLRGKRFLSLKQEQWKISKWSVAYLIHHLQTCSHIYIRIRIGGFFNNSWKAVPLWVVLDEMGWNQPLASMVVKNATAHGLTHITMNTISLKLVYIRFNSLKFQVVQQQLHYLWWWGSTTLHTS